MSAPRKIWAYDDGLNSPDSRTWSATVPVGPVYHHDDVVRELIRAGSNMHVFVDLYGDEAMRSAAAEWRAALAKIAQEG